MSETQFVEVKGINTRYIEAGSGEPLVLFHGGEFGNNNMMNAEAWCLNIEGLAETFRVFAMDKLGMGYTDNPKTDKDYTIGAVVNHAYDFLETLELDQVNLVGQSRGGYLVARLALEHPEIVKNLVIVDSGSMSPGSGAEGSFNHDLTKRNPAQVGTKEHIRYIYEAQAFSASHITEEWLENMQKMARLPKFAEMQAKMRDLRSAFYADFDLAKAETLAWLQEGRLRTPTLVIWGLNDPSAPLNPGLELFRLISAHATRAEMHIFNHAGHHSFREHPDEFNRVITNFVE
jgi:2-hydroxy-6-oxonona-2,4-dienedioate hydrolase